MKLSEPPTTFGIEYTFCRSDGEDIEYKQSQQLERSIVKHGLRGYERTSGYDECGAFEIPSPIFKTTKEFLKYDTKLRKWARKHRLKPRVTVDDTEIGDGGGHIHLGLPRTNQLQFMQRLWVWYLYNPWPTWLFHTWFDDESAVPLEEQYSVRSLGDWLTNGHRPFLIKEAKAINFRYRQHNSDRCKTVEFRHFRAAANQKEQIAHLNFVFAIYRIMTTLEISIIMERCASLGAIKEKMKIQGLDAKVYDQFYENMRVGVEQGIITKGPTLKEFNK